MKIPVRTFDTAKARWTGVGPYFAMFPADFCDHVVRKYTGEGDFVLDPFGGRGTAVFSAASNNRRALGIELNPVGWLYGKTKLHPAPEKNVLQRLVYLGARSEHYIDHARSLPRFFFRCFHRSVRTFLLAARNELDWEHNSIDRTLMAFILINLHGKRHDSLSNQMRQTKAMAPKYALRWWAERDLRAPKIDPVEYIQRKIEWRYAKGAPTHDDSDFILGDSTEILPSVGGSVPWNGAALLFTSPPYFGITNYHYDQWLRLWMLGGAPTDAVISKKYTRKFANRAEYEGLLNIVFASAAPLMSRRSTVYVRTDRRQPTYSLTLAALKAAFPKHHLSRKITPYKKQTQTALFGHFAPKFGEVDLIMTRSS